MINCFFVRRGYRGKGMMAGLLAAAVELAKEQGANAVEACPIEPARDLMWGEGFVGLASALSGSGFSEIARRSPIRPLMRVQL